VIPPDPCAALNDGGMDIILQRTWCAPQPRRWAPHYGWCAPLHRWCALQNSPPSGWQFAEMIVRPAYCCAAREAEPRVKLRNREYGLWSAKSVMEFRSTKNPCPSGRFEFICICEDESPNQGAATGKKNRKLAPFFAPGSGAPLHTTNNSNVALLEKDSGNCLNCDLALGSGHAAPDECAGNRTHDHWLGRRTPYHWATETCTSHRMWQNSAPKWPNPATKVAEFWQKSGRILAEKWPYSGTKVEEFWQESARILAQKWQNSGRKVAEFCLKSD
jgi:hypothetical protein